MPRSVEPPRLSAAAHAVRQSVFAALQGRIDARRASGADIIGLQIGDTHLAPPAAVTAASMDSSELSIYGAVPGLTDLRRALAERHHGRGFAFVTGADNVHLGCGCTHALFCAARAVLDPGDEVVVVSPYWPLIVGVLRTAGAVPVELPLSFRLYREPELDLGAAIEAVLSPRTRAIYFATPNNPDGQVYDRAALEAMAGVAERHDLWVIADEVYADFVYAGRHGSIATLPAMADRTITGYSLSKSHALAGARIGYVVASEDLVAAARRISNHTIYNVPVPMQRAALAALHEDGAWLATARERYHAARNATADELAGLGVDFVLPRGGAYFFLDLAPVLAGRPLQGLLERAIDQGVLVAPGEAFGEHFGTFARLCFTGAPLDVVLDGVRRFKRAVESFA
jgi:aspartate/methionine/tyrosine aminotransferase